MTSTRPSRDAVRAPRTGRRRHRHADDRTSRRVPGSPVRCWTPSTRGAPARGRRPGRPTGQTWAVVPLRGLESAKTRLGGGPRRGGAPRPRVEMADPDARGGARRRRASPAPSSSLPIRPRPTRRGPWVPRALVQVLPGLNAALREGRAEAVRAGATAILVLPIDLPAVDAAALDALLVDDRRDAVPRSGGRPPVVAVVPDRHGLGTNALFIAPAAAIDPAFGDAELRGPSQPPRRRPAHDSSSSAAR